MKISRDELWKLLQTMPPVELVRVWAAALGFVPEAVAAMPSLSRIATEVNAHPDRGLILCGMWDVLGAKALVDFKASRRSKLARAALQTSRQLRKQKRES